MRRNALVGRETKDRIRRVGRSGGRRGPTASCLCLVALLAGIAPGSRVDAGPAGMVETSDPPCNAAVVERTGWLMGTTLRARVCVASRPAGIQGIDRAFSRVRGLEERLSTWRSDSDLSRLNNAPPGEWVPVSPETAALMTEVRHWIEATGGAFDPAVGVAIDAWDLRGAGRVPAESELARARAAVGTTAWELSSAAGESEPARLIRREEGVRLDAGAFGKGAALRAALDELRSPPIRWVLLDFGGQLTLWSRNPDDRWSIGIADPEQRDRPVARLRVGTGSIATTGASERVVQVDGRRFGHVIDPRSAAPVSAWGSVTVFTNDPLAADVLSTALFVLGPDAARSWPSKAPGASPGVLVVESRPDGPRLHTNDRLDVFASIEPEGSTEVFGSTHERHHRGTASHDL